MQESTEAVIYNNNQLLEQVADLISKYDTADGKAALGECMALIIKANSQALIGDLQNSINSSEFGGTG